MDPKVALAFVPLPVITLTFRALLLLLPPALLPCQFSYYPPPHINDDAYIDLLLLYDYIDGLLRNHVPLLLFRLSLHVYSSYAPPTPLSVVARRSVGVARHIFVTKDSRPPGDKSSHPSTFTTPPFTTAHLSYNLPSSPPLFYYNYY